MIISNGVTEYSFFEYNINYIKLIDKTLTFYLTDSTETAIVFTEEEVITNEIDNFVKRMHTVLATCGAGTTGTISSGIIYWINCKNANTVELNSDQIVITFSQGEILTAVLENPTEAEREYEYIMFCYHNADLDRFTHNKKLLKVNPAYTTNAGKNQYKTYTEARADAIAGDVIYFENCDYITGTERFVLKDQVDIIFKNTYVEITEAAFWRPVFPSIKPTYAHKPLFCDEAGVVTVYVLGNVNVRHAANTSGWAVVDMKNDNSKIFIAFNKLWADPIPANIISFFHLNADTRIWAKGFSTIGGRVYDDDQYPALQLNNIDYIDYYKLEDDKITVVNVIADIIEIEVPNYFTAKYTSDQFFATNYKRLVTVPDENGIPYIINITEVVSTDKSANILSIAFATHTLDITCLNDDHAERNKTYVDKVKYGYNILNTFTGTRKYLNLNGLEDYSTLTQALANIGTNELLIIRAGTYTDYIVPIPNGTNIYCENGVIINAEFRNETFHSYNIYGHANFDSVTGTSFFVQAQGEVRPLSYIECKDIRGGVRTTLNFNGIMKCRNVTNYGANCTLFDTDGATYLDCDAVNITISGADVVFIAYINQSRHATLRNAKITNTGVATYYVNEAYAEYEYNLINCRVKNIGLDIQFGVISCFSNGEIQTFNIFRSIMETNSPNVFYNDDINFNQINLIGVSYSNKVGSGQSNYDSNKLEVNAATSINDIYNLSTATTDPISVDLDILYLTTTDVSQNLLFFPFSKECNWRLRNFYAIGGYTSDYNIGGSFRFVNCKFSKAQFPTTYEGIEYFKIWRCIFDYDSYIAIGDVTPSLENFNQSFAKGNGLPDGTETLPNLSNDFSTILVAGRLPEGIGNIQQLEGEVSDNKFILRSPNVINAEFFEIYKDDILLDTVEVVSGQDLYYEYRITDRDIHTFKTRAYA